MDESTIETKLQAFARAALGLPAGSSHPTQELLLYANEFCQKRGDEASETFESKDFFASLRCLASKLEDPASCTRLGAFIEAHQHLPSASKPQPDREVQPLTLLLRSFRRWFLRQWPQGLLGTTCISRENLLGNFGRWCHGHRHLMLSGWPQLSSLLDPMPADRPRALTAAAPAAAGTAVPRAPAGTASGANGANVAPSIQSLRKTWGPKKQCQSWTTALGDLDASVPAQTWFLGWSDTGYGHGTIQICRGLRCPLNEKGIGRSKPILYTPIVADFPKVKHNGGTSFGHQDERLLGCMYVCSPECAAKAVLPAGYDAQAHTVATFRTDCVFPDKRFQAPEKVPRDFKKAMLSDTQGVGIWSGVLAALPQELQDCIKTKSKNKRSDPTASSPTAAQPASAGGRGTKGHAADPSSPPVAQPTPAGGSGIQRTPVPRFKRNAAGPLTDDGSRKKRGGRVTPQPASFGMRGGTSIQPKCLDLSQVDDSDVEIVEEDE